MKYYVSRKESFKKENPKISKSVKKKMKISRHPTSPTTLPWWRMMEGVLILRRMWNRDFAVAEWAAAVHAVAQGFVCLFGVCFCTEQSSMDNFYVSIFGSTLSLNVHVILGFMAEPCVLNRSFWARPWGHFHLPALLNRVVISRLGYF